mgnify:CR=1 FL=1
MIELTKNFIDNKKRVLAIGNFDGFHRGHQMLFSSLNSFKNCVKTILTFENLDKSYHNTNKILMTLKDKEDIKEKYNIDEILYIRFTNEFKNLTPEEFFEYYINNLNIDAIIVGNDFRFGKNLSGNVETIKKLFKKQVIVINLLIDNTDQQKISTTNIIKLIKDSNIKKANYYLNREYAVNGKIIYGLQNGHRLGFPTANIKLSTEYVLPGNGVYATKIKFRDKTYLSMTNIGRHPTLDELESESIETNIFDFKEDIYDEKVELFFLDFIRPERKYSSKEELIQQLTRDREYIINNYN